jgi:PAS domain S-box-containing protein
MRLLRNLPIRRKVILVILLISAAALLLTGGALFAFQLITFRNNFARDLTALGEIVASHSAAALTFKDKDGATELLQALKVKPTIAHAQLRLADGSLFAQFGETVEWKPEFAKREGLSFEKNHFAYCKRIKLDNEDLGVLYLRSDYGKEFRKLLELYGSILGLVLTVSILLTVLLSSRLQRVISEPILSLARTAQVVAAEKDYSVRAEKLEEDEIGQFTDAFNQMLDQIQRRDTALQRSQQKFETLVNSIEGIVWEANPDTLEFSFVSKQAESLLGFPVKTWLESPTFWAERIHPEDLDHVLEGVHRAIRQRQPCRHEYRVKAENRALRWIRSYCTVVLEQDRPVLLRGVFLDITKEKQAAEELGVLHSELLQASRQAGMAEVATGVLHNVGNVLNSINVSITVVCERVRHSEVETLSRLATIFSDHQADLPGFLSNDPKGRLIPGFVQSLAGELQKERRETLQEFELLIKNIEHIKEIVAMQQSYARRSGVVESLQPSELVEDALQINAAGFARHRVEIVRQFDPVPKVQVDRHKVLQILINIFRNAKYAMDEADPEHKRLIVSVAMEGQNKVKISVCDNGAGIPAENLTRIFSHGFTTKKDGHGFGLHSGALAAREMGGALYAYSDGPGRGATFTLELPISEEKLKEAA